MFHERISLHLMLPLLPLNFIQVEIIVINKLHIIVINKLVQKVIINPDSSKVCVPVSIPVIRVRFNFSKIIREFSLLK